MAIVLAFSSAPIFRLLANEGDPRSFFMRLIASLVHFIVVQAAALILGVLGKMTGNRIADGFALFFLFYGVMVTVATGIQLLQTAGLYNAQASLGTEGEQAALKRQSDQQASQPPASIPNGD
ncbi:hypothetical protein ACVSQB_23845 [Bradyrhizobium elkanii]